MAQQTPDIRLINEFMSSWQRLFKIGVYYPSGHEILDKATDRFLKVLMAVAGDERAVTLEYSGGQLKLAGLKISDKLPFVKEFKDQLSALAVTSITFDRQATADEILLLVRQLLASLAATRSARCFTRIDLASLPPSVNVRQEEFVSQGRAAGSGYSETGSQHLEMLYQALAEKGLSPMEIDECRRLLAALPEQASQHHPDAANLPSASWDDVARLLALYVRQGEAVSPELAQPFISNSNIKALASIFQDLAAGSGGDKARQAIHLLVSASRKPQNEEQDAAGKPAPDLHRRHNEVATPPSAGQLQEFVNSNAFKPVILERIPAASTDAETLSMLLHLAAYPLSENSRLRMELLLRKLLGDEAGERHQQLLEQGLTMLLAKGDEEPLNMLLPIVLAPLRRSETGLTLPLLLRLTRHGDRNSLYTLWPHIVNELLLVGNTGETSDYLQLAVIASQLPIDAMPPLLPRLQSLPSFTEGAVAGTIGQGLTRECFLVFAFLLKTEHKQLIAERLLPGLRDYPPDLLLSAILPVLSADRPDHQLFLQAYLQQAGMKKLSAALPVVAGKIIVSQLAELPRERRSDPWVCNTVAALASMPSDEVREFLQLVQSQKKIMLIPEWPVEVREAATSALARRRRR